MYNKCIYGFISLFSFCFAFFLSFFDLIHISQMDIIMTAKHVMHNNFFCLFSINITDIQLRLKQNKHHPLKPILFNNFFSSDRCTNVFFHSLKYYTVEKEIMFFFTFFCNSGANSSFVSLKTISVTRISPEVTKVEHFNAFSLIALHSAYLLQ